MLKEKHLVSWKVLSYTSMRLGSGKLACGSGHMVRDMCASLHSSLLTTRPCTLARVDSTRYKWPELYDCLSLGFSLTLVSNYITSLPIRFVTSAFYMTA